MNITFKQFREKLQTINDYLLASKGDFNCFIGMLVFDPDAYVSFGDVFHNPDLNEVLEAFFPDVPKIENLSPSEQKFCSPNKKSKHCQWAARIFTQDGILEP